ncbi:MAG: hypothetical protein ACJAYW_001342, partial [Candidatus Azotimanducaceae bacterium]
MKKMSGFVVSEYVTAVIILVVSVAVVFGLYVSNQRDNMVESAEASLEAVKMQAAAAAKGGKLIACDDSLVEAEVLANGYISLSIRPTPIDESNLEEGYGAGIYVHSNKEADGSDTFVTAVRLHKAIKEKDKEALRGLKIKKENKKEKDIEYSILL